MRIPNLSRSKLTPSIRPGAKIALVLAVACAFTPAARPGRVLLPKVPADFVYFNLSAGELSQDWSNPELITENDDWSKVPGIVGFRGGNGKQEYGIDPRKILRNFSVAAVAANTRLPATPSNYNSGGIFEFDQISNPTVALNATTTADAPHLVIYLDTRNRGGATVHYDVRDLDCSTDEDKKMVATQYRVRKPDGPSDPRQDQTPWQNVTTGVNTFIPDATDTKSCRRVTHVVARLPADALNQPRVEVRIITTNNEFLEEMIGIDNIRTTSVALQKARRK